MKQIAERIQEEPQIPGVPRLIDDPDTLQEDPDEEDPDYEEDPEEEGPDDEELDEVESFTPAA
jgi:hypothetical protein